MPKRKGAKKLGWLFWVGPMIAVVMAPLMLFFAVEELSQSTDEHLIATMVLLSAIAFFSLLGCLLDDSFQCPYHFPAMLLLAQLFALVVAILLWPSIFKTLPKPNEMEHWLMDKLRAQPAQPLTESITERPLAPSNPAPAAVSPATPLAKRALRGSEEVSLDIAGWKDVGDGFCVDSQDQEFSSLHAVGKSLRECAAIAAGDPESIAFDFSSGDGGCDIRFPAGATFESVEGFEWWGWGAGKDQPKGSQQRKHESETRCYLKTFKTPARPRGKALSSQLHPKYKALIREYPFQPVRNEHGRFVNVILVRSPFRTDHQEQLYQKFKDEILFLGISSWEDYPLPAPNPYSSGFPPKKFVGLFPGFLYMHRNPETIFPSHVKLLLLSQSDFSLPALMPALEKKYDFTFSGSDQDVAQDCMGWSSYAKNWSFVKEALEVMCGELQMTGVLVATKDKQGRQACSIPASCEGLITQTTFLNQDEFFKYTRQSQFLFLSQVHDASPRVITQALALDVPVLMNKNIIGGWKYLTDQTGEGFNDIHDLQDSIQRLRENSAAGAYHPRRYVDENCGDQISGERLTKFVLEHFSHRVKLPEGTKLLFPSGA
ncbi:unnamed protein product [Cladocopium goreaui]|uniref:Major facilitator superfamily domain-containing protein 6 n=1 Tax=Cladocopium goreaui TaxID=2562237 RepID=A0A9P1CHJ0_9DINO|nr:unnamed protein product [Cladocopium goreaui]